MLNVNKTNSEMSNTQDVSVTKRSHDGISANECDSKKQKTQDQDEAGRPYKKKKMALLMMFCGKDYYGMQRNPGFLTIEGLLMEALLQAGVVTQDHVDNPREKMAFQRASRTDKGVSCVGQVVSLKINVENAVQKINDVLPKEIRVLEAIQTTKGFDAKMKADSRSYSYTMPTLALTPHTEEIKEDFRVTEDILAKTQDVLNMFKGSHNFYNYTSGRPCTDKSCVRYIMEFYLGEKFTRDNMEYVVIHVKGQSFMLHQIRKMIGMTIGIVQGLVTKEYLELSWGPERLDVPKAPGVGLMLDEVHFSNYNRKFGHDGIHTPITFSNHKERIQKFKEEFIYPNLVEAELKEKSMFEWSVHLREKHFQKNPLNKQEPEEVNGSTKETASDTQETDTPDHSRTETGHLAQNAQHTETNLQTDLDSSKLASSKILEEPLTESSDQTDARVLQSASKS